MFTVTDAATQHLATLLDDAEAPEGAAARIVVSEEGLKIGVDQVNDGDETWTHGQRVVLAIDQQTAMLLSAQHMDVAETEEGVALTIRSESGDEENQDNTEGAGA